MANKLTPEVLEKAKAAKTAEELIALAKENGTQLTAEEANTYFAKLNPKMGELNDDELDDVAGGDQCGTTYKDGWPVVSILNSCDLFEDHQTHEKRPGGYCIDCAHHSKDGLLELCKNPKRRNN